MSRRKRRNGKSKAKVPPTKTKNLPTKLKSIKKIQPRKKKVLLKSNLKNTYSSKNGKLDKSILDTRNAPVSTKTSVSSDKELDIPSAVEEEKPLDNHVTEINGPDDSVVTNTIQSKEDIIVNNNKPLPIKQDSLQHDLLISELSNQTTEDSSDAEFQIDLSRTEEEEDEEEDMEGDHDNSRQNFCVTCNLSFGSRSALTAHMKQHTFTNNHMHQCLICNKILSSASSLDRHMLVHSGERPFKCKLCDMSFTTNGNMHRHMRTHGDVESMDEDKSLDLRKKDVIKCDNQMKLENIPNETDKKIHCPVCGKTFLCKYGLQSHMETHPNDPILCQKCDTISINYNAHIDHKCDIASKQSAKCYSMSCGFQDLTFMDFTSNKFSLVSKSYCEQNLKRPSSAFHKFECSKCNKAFPCGRALKLHEKVHDTEIGTFCPSCHCDFAASPYLQLHQLKHRNVEHCLTSVPDNLNVSHSKVPHAGKEDFLALLNLQTKQSHLSLLQNLRSMNVKEENFENYDYFVHGKMTKKESEKTDCESITNNNNNNNTINNNDFADIQSIITLTSKAPLIPSAQTSPIAVRPASPVVFVSSCGLSSPPIAESANASPDTPSKEEGISSVESQTILEADDIAAETQGVYPCTICSQKFKNNNAYKRHAKLHVQRGSNYSCHICSYVSVDKSTLIRHLRTHNGERPFQCVICKYAFTTKANCERHVRKRHKKFSKAEIRSAMQYNPNMSLRTADPTTVDISNSETVCKYCGVDFKFNRVLRHHLRSLHNSCNRKPFSCKICKFGFSTKNNCIRHVLKQHPNLKDKLRSVVIPNPQMPPPLNSDLTSGTDNSNSSTGNQPTNDQVQPLDLHFNEEDDKPLDLQIDKLSNEFNVNETVIAAEGLVCLSEAPPLQEEPLDLAAQALDLSCKPLSAVTKKDFTKPFSIFSSKSTDTSNSDGSIDLTSLKTPSPTTPKLETGVQISPLPMNSKKIEPINNKINGLPATPGQKERAFSCVYCHAGFTLKSNMERHIKRKHPEFARPTRSRNYIPSIVSPNLPKQNLPTLSDETRNALRHHVLNTKVQQFPVYKNLNSEGPFQKGSINFKTVVGAHGFVSPINQVPCPTSILNLSLDLTSKPEKINTSTPKSSAENVSDEACSDLASVSSVICTANSPQFTQYLGKPTDTEKADTSSSLDKCNNVEDVGNMKKVENTPVSCPYCERQFPWTSSLRRHMLTHTGQKPFKCPKCSLWFTTKSNCERHLIRKHGHKGDLITRSVPDRPYKCNHCLTSTFSTQGNLRKHFYLKHWTKSYLGMNCKPEKKSGDSNSLTTIDDSDKKPNDPTSAVATQEHSYSQPKRTCTFSCQFCDKEFDGMNDLSAHMFQHNGVIYVCYLCRKTFPNHTACYNHFKTSHSLVYLQINQKAEIVRNPSDKLNEDSDSFTHDKGVSSVACMVCFQKMSSVEHLQQHFKSHLFHEKQIDELEVITSKEAVPMDINSVGPSPPKKARVTKNKVNNSLLYLFSKANNNNTQVKSNKNGNSKIDISTEENSDLIQNLLGIHDSKTIDEMLISPDSAARILGVKEM